MRKLLVFCAIILIAMFVFAVSAGQQEEYRIITASGHESWGSVIYHDGYGYILMDPIAVFTKDQSLTSMTIEQIIANKKGIVTRGDSYGANIDELLKTTDVIVAQNPEEAKQMLLKEEGDYFLFSLYGGEKLFENDDVFSSVVGNEYFYFGVSKRNPNAEEIVQILNNYIREHDLLKQ